MRTKIPLLLAIALACTAASGQSYPSKPIRMIVGYTPGGATDLVARTLAGRLQESLGQPVVVENKPGANSNIGSEFVARSAPDGYTLLLGTIANAINMAAYTGLAYDTLRDFAPITQTMSAPSVLAAHPSLPVKDLNGLIALAREHPNTIAFASSGNGSSPHLAGELLKLRAGIQLVHIPYKGAAPALNDLLAGHVPIGFQTALSAMPYLQSGKLRVLGVASPRRLAQLPDVPTIAEAGLPQFEVSSWNGLLAPARTPPEVIAALHAASVKVLASSDVREKFAAQGAETVGSSPDEFRAYIRAEIEKWTLVIRASGAKFD